MTPPQLLLLIPLCSYAMQIAQIVTPSANNSASDLVQIAEHLTLTGALIVAVVILWRTLVAKDNLIIRSTEEVTKAMAATAVSNAELRKIIGESILNEERLGAAIKNLSDSVSQIHNMVLTPRQKG